MWLKALKHREPTKASGLESVSREEMRLARQMGPEYKGRETKVGHPRHRVLTG